ncbi:MAG: hypothetical protein LBN74_03095 [Prevotella sp.]|nr:hypothetical protein [Prevotella sp.]
MLQDSKYNRYTIATLKVGLLLVLILYLFSTNFFYHIHIIDGEMILHSHPYSAKNANSPIHSHTGTELNLVQQLMHFEVSGSIVPSYFIAEFQNKPVILLSKVYQSAKIEASKTDFRLRAPPIL